MFSLSNQIKSPDDEDEEPEDCDNSIKPPTFPTYNYNHHFQQTFDFTPNSWTPHNQKSPVFEGFDFSSQKLKPKNKRPHAAARVVQSTGRKDRHSKVRTARGPRDRRVRLSPRTAIQFYDVQDRLGYDRPSKAIDWLINEAKAAIDALNHQQIENQNGFSVDKNPFSGFGFCVDGAPPPPPAPDFSPSVDYQQGFCSAFSETNWEFARLQKMLNWNSGDDFSGNAAAISGHGGNFLSQREPLQSSFVNYSPIGNADFPAFNFCNELLNVTASATLMKEDEREKKKKKKKIN